MNERPVQPPPVVVPVDYALQVIRAELIDVRVRLERITRDRRGRL